MVLTTTFGAPPGRAEAAAPQAPSQRVLVVEAVDDVEVVLSFGDLLTELHDALSYEQDSRDTRRVDRACDAVVDAHPQLRDAVDGDDRFPLLLAAESMVDACRRGFAASLDLYGYEIVTGDYHTYRELSLELTT